MIDSVRSIQGIPVERPPRQARKPAGIITTSLGKGMNELSIVIKINISMNPHSGAQAVRLSSEVATASVIAVKPYLIIPHLRIVAASFSRLAAESSHSGRRYSSSINPAIAIAALIGMGLVSMNWSRKNP